jgi:LemA protein
VGVEIVIAAAVVLAVASVMYGYNRLVTVRNRVDTAWADLDVQLARRRQLIPDLIAVVQGYAAHERETLQAVTEARTKGERAHDPHEQASAEVEIDQALSGLFAVAEAYPDLKADARFRDLQTELVNTENKVAFSRQLFNDTVTQYANLTQRFPTNLLAGATGFTPPALFETDKHEVPGVSLH